MSQRDCSRSVAITLVHGTWGRGFFPEWHLWPWKNRSRRVRWFEDESSFRRTLSDDLTNKKLSHSFHQFQWSGTNSVFSRENAASSLSQQLHDQLLDDEISALVVIAHSHAGNVALRSLSKLKNDTKDIFLITMATPFLSYYQNQYANPHSKYAANLDLVMLITMFGCFFLIGPQLPIDSLVSWLDSRPWFPKLFLFPFAFYPAALLALVYMAISLIVGGRSGTDYNELSSLNELNSRHEVLVLRSVNDEANLALTFGLAGVTLSDAALWLFGLFVRRWWVIALLLLLLSLGFAIPDTWANGDPGKIAFLAFSGLVYFVVSAVQFLGWLWLALIAAPIMLSAICKSINGRELLFGGIRWDVNVQSAPDCWFSNLQRQNPYLNAFSVGCKYQLFLGRRESRNTAS
jgi:hypothetical protein